MTENTLEAMTVNEKIVAVRSKLDLNRNKFAKLVNIAPSTIARIEEGGSVSVETLEKIAGTLEGVTVDWLRDDSNHEIPSSIRFSEHYIETGINDSGHEGKRLKRFLMRHEISQSDLAKQLGVSRTQVHHYTGTERFHRDVRDSFLAAFHSMLERPVTQTELFGSSEPELNNAVEGKTKYSDFRGVPTIDSDVRRSISADEIRKLREDFAPAIAPELATYINKSMIGDSDFKKTYAITIVPSDHMEPLLPAGFKVLGMLLTESEYDTVTDGVVALKIKGTDGVIVKKIVSNNLRTTGILELSSYDLHRGGSVQVRLQDIELMMKVTRSLGGPI